jgi:hypothetical protein
MTARQQDNAPRPTKAPSSTPTETLWRAEDDPQRFGALLRLLFDPEPASRRG